MSHEKLFLPSFLPSFLVFAWMMLLFPLSLSGQFSIAIAGPSEAEVGIPAQFSYSVVGVPAPGEIYVETRWYVTALNPDGTPAGNINGSSNNPYAVPNAPWFGNATITWGEQDEPVTAKVKVALAYETLSGVIVEYFHEKEVLINAICPPSISGPTEMQTCCVSPVTYCVSDYCDGNIFDWTVPSGWIYESADGYPCITVMSNGYTNGQVSCKVSRLEANGAYFKKTSLSVEHIPPAIYRVAPFEQDTLCRKTVYSYSVEPICGATLYNWEFPSGWELVSGQGTNSVEVYATETAQSGALTVSVSFYEDNCGTVMKEYYLNVLTTSPPPPEEVTQFYSNAYHCNEWWMCSGGNYVQVPNQIDFQAISPYVEFMHWELVWHPSNPPTQWHFYNNYSLTSVTTGLQSHSPPIHGPSGAGTGRLKLVVEDFCGNMSWPVYVDFNEQTGYWCENIYPETCECCPPGNYPPGMHVQSGLTEEMFWREEKSSQQVVAEDFENEIWISPSPFSGVLMIDYPCHWEVKQIVVRSATGESCFVFGDVGFAPYSISLENLPSGIYFISIEAKQMTVVKRLMKL